MATMLRKINWPFMPSLRIQDCLGHFMRCATAAFPTKLFDGITVKAENLKTLHPSHRMESLIDSGPVIIPSRRYPEFFSMCCAVIVNMIKTEGTALANGWPLASALRGAKPAPKQKPPPHVQTEPLVDARVSPQHVSYRLEQWRRKSRAASPLS